MNYLCKTPLLLYVLSIGFFSCVKIDSNSEKDSIIYLSVNKQFVLIRDVQTLKESDDEISNRIDSILNGQINAEFITTGYMGVNLDTDNRYDIGFEIVNLNKYNPNGLPESFDSLAARVIPKSIEILDNSTYGYPDALEFDERIDKYGNWTNESGVLGTFLNAGQFKGKGEKYLGIRFLINNNYKFGWIKIYCSHHNDTLRIIEYAYNNSLGNPIKAGQKE
jgi:hypothetical protein